MHVNGCTISWSRFMSRLDANIPNLIFIELLRNSLKAHNVCYHNWQSEPLLLIKSEFIIPLHNKFINFVHIVWGTSKDKSLSNWDCAPNSDKSKSKSKWHGSTLLSNSLHVDTPVMSRNLMSGAHWAGLPFNIRRIGHLWRRTLMEIGSALRGCRVLS